MIRDFVVGSGRWRRFVGGGAVVAGLVLVVWFAVLPGVVRRRSVAEAASRGVVLVVGGVRVGFERFALLDVEASSPELPGMTAKGAEIDVTLSGFDPVAASASRWDIEVDGANVVDALAAWRAAHEASVRKEAVAIHLEDAHVTWTHAFGSSVRIDALGLTADVGADGESSHVATPHVVIATARGDLGPWRMTVDRAGEQLTSRIAFDPAAPSAAHLELVTERDALRSFDAAIPRSSFAKLGIPARALGLPAGEATQIALSASLHLGDRVDVAVDGSLFALKISAVPQPLDATMKLSASATANGAAPVDHASSASIGPLRGAITGEIAAVDGGARLALKWIGGPVPCAALGALEPPPSPPGSPPTLGDLANELGKLAQATGIAKVSGEISMHASLVVDTRDVSTTTLSFTPASTCELALFGAP